MKSTAPAPTRTARGTWAISMVKKQIVDAQMLLESEYELRGIDMVFKNGSL